MKKLGIVMLTIGLMLGAAACGKKPEVKSTEITGGATGTVKPEQKGNGRFTSQDYIGKIYPVGGKTEKGIYRLWKRGIMYYDFGLQKQIYLCNKPECKHDGNQYCVATTSKYNYLSVELYDNTLLIGAVEETDTQYVFHILTAALDGSELEDYMTIARIEKASFSRASASAIAYHRNRALIGISLQGTAGLSDTNCYATYMVNLDTKEVKCLDEEEFGKESVESLNASACGDYLYYVKLLGGKGNKRQLCRCNIYNGTVEAFDLGLVFSGNYHVSGNKILFLKNGSIDLMFYDIESGNTERVGVNKQEIYSMEIANNDLPEGIIPKSLMLRGTQVATDGKYIYVLCGTDLMYYYNDEKETEIYMPVVIYDFDGNYIKTMDSYPMLRSAEELCDAEENETGDYYSWYDGKVYLFTYNYMNTAIPQRIYCCDADAFLNGTGTFELIYCYYTGISGQ